MSGIAELLWNLNYRVVGSDIADSDTLSHLRSLGMPVFLGHDASRLPAIAPDVVVVSSAIAQDNPEILEAKRLGIPVIPRAVMLAELMRLKYGIAVSGAHGKTTTTSMVAHVLLEAGMDPTVVLGGRLKQTRRNASLGKGSFIVVEADESDSSFLWLAPSIAVVTNLDNEHLNSYRDSFHVLQEAFRVFLEKVPFYGLCVYCADDPNVLAVAERLDRRKVGYGLSQASQVRAWGVESRPFGCFAQLEAFGESLGELVLKVPGVHNLKNALAAVAVGLELNIPYPTIARALASFEGIERRFEVRLSKPGLTVIEDYAHHPTEILATLQAFRAEFPEVRRRVVFQPHRFSRVFRLQDQFTDCFDPETDELILLPTYGAGEPYDSEGDGHRLFERISARGKTPCRFASTFDEAIGLLLEGITEPQAIIFLGAGDIHSLAAGFTDNISCASFAG